jgi:DNA-directed RNA polymerase subunit beta'|tara:strand:- start:35381 stop:39172 length:3792 start_codon:yes stop_codon:yes gene_type:complete
MLQEPSTKLVFTNEVINKRKLQNLMYLTFHNYGVIKSSLIADKVKNLTFHYATRSGISLSIEDLRVPFRKRALIGLTNNEVTLTEQNVNNGNITAVERFQKVIDIWNNANNSLKDEVLTYFRESDPLNPLYIMAFSGARGNISQVRQLVGMRGLMSDPQGQIIDLPIKSNFREGLKVTEYIISSYGARKGLVDTALRTADSGYLTRRLVDVAQDIIVREEDCLTQSGLTIHDLFEKYKTELSVKDRLVGRLLAKPLHKNENGSSGPILFEANTEINNEVITKILDLDLTDVTVRSPLTCSAIRSVCRKCYGWHLSYSKLVDLGEAVGILAAQSIGEPGTQLTMRTFHTGGVFSGDLTQQIRAPFSGSVSYSLKTATTLVRTIHGEKGFQLMEKTDLNIEDLHGTVCTLEIPSNAMLLVNNASQVYRNQIIAEIKKDANLILEEGRREIYTDVSGEVFFQNLQLEENIDLAGATKKISKNSGLAWVLYGERYFLKGAVRLATKLGQNLKVNDTLVHQTIVNQRPGIVSLNSSNGKTQIRILNSSLILKNAHVQTEGGNPSQLQFMGIEGTKTFQLCVKSNDILQHGQSLAVLQENTYKTETGGIAYYSIADAVTKKRRTTKKMFTGSLYWVPEETHQLTKMLLEDITIQDGTVIQKNHEILPNIKSNVGGLVQIDDSRQELTIKPGELFILTDEDAQTINQTPRFVKPGELILPHFIVQNLSYLDFVTINGLNYILCRPVSIFQVPQDKGFNINHLFFPSRQNRNITFRIVKRIFYKDGENVKSAKGVQLLQTFLVLGIKSEYLSLKPVIEFVPTSQSPEKALAYKLKVALYESIQTQDSSFKNSEENQKVLLKYMVKDKQYVNPQTALAKIDILTTVAGTLVSNNSTKEILVLKDTDMKKCFYDSVTERLCVAKGDLVRIGTPLTNKTKSKYTGQVFNISSDQIDIRLGRPYLISEGTILQVGPGSLVQKSDMLATLVYDKLKTVDIVQGLPKVEEILEARKIKNGCILAPHEGKVYLRNTKIEIVKSTGEVLSVDIAPKTKVNFANGKYVNFLDPLTDGPVSPHEKLSTLFNYYEAKLPTIDACRISFKYLQLFLVNEVQRTYLSQGVQIADKHIEIIVKQMTSKVCVFAGGDTTLLPGEILEINQADLITKSAISGGDSPPICKPILLGLTKASLNSDSFISAASFQETTRVLTEAAIEGKKDWLNGLKENVIIGRLIPAGTGFNCFETLKKVDQVGAVTRLQNTKNSSSFTRDVLKSRVG